MNELEWLQRVEDAKRDGRTAVIARICADCYKPLPIAGMKIAPGECNCGEESSVEELLLAHGLEFTLNWSWSNNLKALSEDGLYDWK